MSVVPPNIEPLIPLISQLKEIMETMREGYFRLPPLIEREHRAIKSGIFTEVQGICEEKESLTQTIENGFTILTKTAENFGSITNQSVSSISEIIIAIEMIRERVKDDGSLVCQVFRHVAQALEKSAKDLEETARQVKPFIEANRDLIGKLLTSYSQSYRFWQELQEQVSSSYTPDGVQKAIGRVSGFRVRA
jgi:flagellar biosynthesis/type III secretory pathway chaperone